MADEKDIVEEARNFAFSVNDDAPIGLRGKGLLRALADEVDWWKSKMQDVSELDEIRHCDKCDLCEDHHA